MASKHDALETPLSTAYSPQDDDLTLADGNGNSSGGGGGGGGNGGSPPSPVRLVNYPRIILFTAAVYLAFQFFDAITKALLLFFGAFLLAIVLNAPVRWLESHGVKRGMSVAGVALILLSCFGTLAYIGGPRVVGEAATFVQEAPQRAKQLQNRVGAATKDYPAVAEFLNSKEMKPETLLKRAQPLLPRIGRYTLDFFGLLAMLLFVVVVALFTLAAPQPLIRGLLSAVPPGHRAVTTRALTRIVGQLESWAVATLLLMLAVGTICGVGLWAIGIPNALFFGILAGIGEGIPTIGPILSAIPPTMVALAADPTKALWVAGLFLIVQFLENYLLVPWIMSRNLNLHPVSIMFFVFSLGALVGVVGALMAVPAALITKVIFEEFYEKKRAPKLDALDAAADQIVRAGSRPSLENREQGTGDWGGNAEAASTTLDTTGQAAGTPSPAEKSSAP